MPEDKFVPPIPEKTVSSNGFTTEEGLALASLINKHSVTARELARRTDDLQHAMKAEDTEAFAKAMSELSPIKARCEALKLAIDMVRETFQERAQARGSAPGPKV